MRLLAALFFIYYGAANAEYMGTDLASSCENQQSAFCLGYVAGVLDGQRGYYGLANGMKLYCLPPSGLYDQIRLVVVKYLKDHPEQLHFTAENIVALALAQAFPCKAK